MAKTLANLRSNVRMYLDEVSEADWTDSQINSQINYKYMEMYTAVIETFEDYYRTKVTTNLVSGQTEYALPSDFFKLKRLEIKYTNDQDERRAATKVDFQQIPYSTDTTYYDSTYRPVYDFSGSYIKILPQPSENVPDGILMYYIKQISELSSDSSAIDIPFPNRYAYYIEKGAAGALLQKGQQAEGPAAGYLLEFAAGIEKMQSELEDRFIDGTKMIVDTIREPMNLGDERLTGYISTN